MSLTPAEEARAAVFGQGLLPVTQGTGTNCFAETVPRRLCNNISLQPTSATLYVTAVWLPQGTVVTGVTMVSGATAESGGTHFWYCLYKCANPTGVVSATQVATLMAQSTDDTAAAAMAANTALRKALTTAQTCPYTGLYYVGVCVVGTTPTLLNYTSGSVNAVGNITGMTPILAATADTGLTGTAPTTLGTMTAVVTNIYAYID